jgi:hypothetical protein
MAVDPETVTLMGTYRVGFAPPAHGSLTPGELYIEVAPPEGAPPRLWVGTISDGTYPGDAISLAPAGVTLEPLPTAPPVNVDVPYASQSGSVLNCTMGNWEGVPSSYIYQWRIDGVDVPSDGPDINVTETEIGRVATCVVTAQNALGATEAPPSNDLVITGP